MSNEPIDAVAVKKQTVTEALREPFPPEVVQFKPQAINRNDDGALAVAFVDPRDYYERMSEVADWSDDYEIILLSDRVFVKCHITINEITRCDIGESPLLVNRKNKQGNWEMMIDENALTTTSAQAFKRTCTKFGLGAYLYKLPKTWANYDPQKRQFTAGGLNKLRRMLTNQGMPTPNPVSSTPSADTSTGEVYPFDIAKMAEKDGWSAAYWGYDQKVRSGGPNKAGDRVFKSKIHAVNTFKKLRDEATPELKELPSNQLQMTHMATLWMAEVDRRRLEIEEKNAQATG